MNKIIDFTEAPAVIEDYRFGDPVTRGNFINFLILSYAVSRGSFVIQKVFFEMMQHKVGLDHKETIKRLFEAGSFEALSSEEQGLFTQAFRCVKKHSEVFEEIEIDDEMRDEFDGLYDRPVSDGHVPLRLALDFFEFDKVNSVDDFLKAAREFNQRLEDSFN